MKYYLHNQDDVLKTLNSTKDGLSESEANSRLERDGKNKLAEGKKVTAFQRFLSQLANPMIIVLLIAATIKIGRAHV